VELPPPGGLDRDAVLAQLDRILSNRLFQHSRRYPAFLQYVVQKALDGAGDELKERSLGVAVFKRSAEYDTSADPVVRNTASEVRKRLEEYYSDAEHSGELRISLPVGGYLPEFRSAPDEPPTEPAVTLVPKAPSKRSRRWIWAGAATFAAVAAIAGGVRLAAPKPAIDRFWRPILQGNDSILAVTETLMAVAPPRSAEGNSAVTEAIDPKLFLSVQESSAKLASLLQRYGKIPDIELARNVTLPRLRRGPFILLGAFNNPWTRRSVASLRFYLELDRERLIRRILDRQNPSRQDWAAPMGAALQTDYALIVRAPDPDTGTTMLVIAGLGERGSGAAMEFVTNPKYLASVDRTLPEGWDRRNIELVIQTKLVNEEWGEPQLVTHHVW
jgi:hypothetical protein